MVSLCETLGVSSMVGDTSRPSDALGPIAVRLHRVQYRLESPHSAAHGVEALRDLIIVEVQLEDSTIGWGECSTLSAATYTSEYTAGAWLVLRDYLVPALLSGRDAKVVGHPMAVAGLTSAVDDANLRRLGVSMRDALAELGGFGTPRSAVERCAVVGRRDRVDDLVGEVAEKLEAKVSAIKLKIGPTAEDLAAVGAVRATWPDLSVAVDFNGTADADAIRSVARHNLTYVEQPARSRDMIGSAQFAKMLGCPVALDESIAGLDDLRVGEELGAGSVLNVKPSRCGGLAPSVELVGAASSLGWKCFVGGMVESGIGRSGALALAAQELMELPTDLGPSLDYVDVDLTVPIVTDAYGRVVIPDGPGIGVEPFSERLAERSVDSIELTRQ